MATTTLGPVGYINPAPVTTSWENPAVHPFNRFFGGVTLSPELHPYDAYDETTWTLPEALIGKSKFLGQTFELLALMQNSFLLTVILPLVKTDEIQSHWSRWEFPAFVPDMVPHLGVVRFVKSNRISGKSTMARYGIGIFLEHGFMNSEEGVQHYTMNIRQVLAAVIEGMQLEALQALINVGNYEANLARKVNPSNTTALAGSMKAAMDRELFAWGCLQQNSNAWALMDKKIDEITQLYLKNRNRFTHYVTSTKIDAFIRQIPYDQVTASIYGPDAQRKIRDGVQDFRVDEFGNRIFSSRPFLLDDKPVDPFERNAQIGEYYRCFNHVKEQMENYTTASRNQMIYDEDLDTFVKITLRQKVDHSHRFGDDGKLLHVSEARKRGNYKEDGFSDFLHYKDENGKLEVVRYMLHLNKKDFDANDYGDFVTTFFNALKKRYGHQMSDYENAVRELREVLSILGTYSYDANMDTWLQLLARKNVGVTQNIGPNKNLSSEAGSIKNNSRGSLDIPTSAEMAGKGIPQGKWILPPTHGDYGGLKTISDTIRQNTFPDNVFVKTYAESVSRSLALFEELADGIHSMLPGTVTASPKFVNGAVHYATHRHALFENLASIGSRPRYLFLHTAQPGAGGNYAGVEYGAADDSYAGSRIDDSLFPKIGQSRGFLMNNFLGNLEASSGAAADFIGERIDYPAAGDTSLRYSPLQTPAAAVKGARYTVFAETRGLTGGNPPDFNAVVGTDSLADAVKTRAANAESAVYDTVARWSFLPYPGDAGTNDEKKRNVNFYTLHTLVIFALAMVKINAGNRSKTYENVAYVLDTIQRTVGVSLHQVNDGTRTANAVDALKRVRLESLIDALKELYQEKAEVFNSHVTASKFDQIQRELKQHAVQVLEDTRSIDLVPIADANSRTAAGWRGKRNAQLSVYKPAPISLGRKAMIDYLDFGKTGSGIRRAIPVSFKDPSVFMSESELEMALSLQSTTTSDVSYLKKLSAEVGEIFAPESIREILVSDIGMLPMIKNAESRVRGRDEEREEEEEIQRGIARERSISAAKQNAGRLQALIGGIGHSGQKRQRSSYESENSTASLPSIPASQKSFFKENQITASMRQMYTELVNKYLESPASLMIAVSYGFTPFTKQLLDSTVANNLDHPVDYLVVRPHATYTTVGVIKMIPGLETGQMCFGNIIAEVGDDAAIQTHLVTETHYQGALIKTPKNICVLNDVLVTGYKGGLSSGFIDINSYDPSTGVFGKTSTDSIMVFMISRHDEMNSNYFSLLGKAVWVDRQGNADRVDRVTGFGYGTADYYNAVWGFRNHRWNENGSRSKYDSVYLNQVVTPNAIVFKSLFYSQDPLTKKYVPVSAQTGHFKSHTVGTGMHRARIGETTFKNIPINPLEQRHDISLP